VRQLAKDLNATLVEINLEIDKTLKQLFLDLNIQKIITEIEWKHNIDFKAEKLHLLFLDEIQAIPESLQSLRYFYENFPHIKIICAGSLLEFALEEGDFSMPVGRVEYYFLGPIMFSEYLRAVNEKLYRGWQEINLDNHSTALHEKLTEQFYKFLSVGGMPEVTQKLILEEIAEAQRSLLTLIYNFKNDFNKYKKRVPLERLEKIYEYAGTHIGQKVKYSNISHNDQARELRTAIDLLAKSQVIKLVFHSACSGIPLNIQKDEKVFKFLFLDIGLYIAMSGMNARSLEVLLSGEKNEMQLLILGQVHEQFIGQHLLYRNPYKIPELFYWLREGRSNNAEVDFVLQDGLNIIPIEVKSGRTGSLKSLNQFMLTHKGSSAVKFQSSGIAVTNVKMENHNYKLIQLPHYLVERLDSFQ
jgi:predicted AAA+ superfamily ATPase